MAKYGETLLAAGPVPDIPQLLVAVHFFVSQTEQLRAGGAGVICGQGSTYSQVHGKRRVVFVVACAGRRDGFFITVKQPAISRNSSRQECSSAYSTMVMAICSGVMGNSRNQWPVAR